MAKIQLCPFCDATPKVEKRQSGAGFWLVSCRNPDCCVIVETRATDRADAVDQWNRRPLTSHESQRP